MPTPTGIQGNPSPPAVMPPPADCVGRTRVVAVGSGDPAVVVAGTGGGGADVDCAVATDAEMIRTPSANSPQARPRRTGDKVVR